MCVNYALGSPHWRRAVLSVPAKAEVYLRTEKKTVGFLLTQTEEGRKGGWRDE